jgi:hypothetical protein
VADAEAVALVTRARGAVAVADAEAVALVTRARGAVVEVAACLDDLQPVTKRTEQSAVLSTAM